MRDVGEKIRESGGFFLEELAEEKLRKGSGRETYHGSDYRMTERERRRSDREGGPIDREGGPIDREHGSREDGVRQTTESSKETTE
ncbi:hypothetical protein DY000_02038863 [Brassica cretica]|uniref:Uncharacterized protein n=1 Tax=Brassica cretica TaxID=69181 RepID=A0ABQ7BLD3_BRACR|nr:hypothetical protein DY000_02038863 [Brassica cretica]